jgi:hypothetical protein
MHLSMGAACREAYLPATSSVRRLPRWRRPQLSTTLPRTYLIHSVTIHLKYRDGLLLERASFWPACGLLAEVRCALPGLASGLALAVRPAGMAPALKTELTRGAGIPSRPALTHPRPAPSRTGCGACAPSLPPIGLTAAGLFAGGVKGLIRVYVDQALSPALVARRSHRPLMPYRRRMTIRRQSGGGPLQLPRSSRTRWSWSLSPCADGRAVGDRLRRGRGHPAVRAAA